MDEEYVPKMKAPDEFLGYYLTSMIRQADNKGYRLLFKCFRTSNKYGNYNRHFYYAVLVGIKLNNSDTAPLPKRRKYNLKSIKPPEYVTFELVENVEGYENNSATKTLEKIGRSGRSYFTNVIHPSSDFDRQYDISTLKMFKNEIAKDQENMEL